MLPKTRFGRTGLQVTRLALGGFPFGGVNRAQGWDPFTPDGRAAAIRAVRAADAASGGRHVDHPPRRAGAEGDRLLLRKARLAEFTKAWGCDSVSGKLRKTKRSRVLKCRRTSLTNGNARPQDGHS